MSLIGGVLGMGRALAKSRMTETVTVGLFEDRTDPAGDPIRVLVTERYSGIGRVRWSSHNVTNADGPAMPAAVQEPVLSIPHGSPRLFDGDEVRVDTSKADDMLVGRRFTVQGNVIGGQTTAHRYPLTDLG